MTRRPARTRLFPYTALFRSEAHARGDARRDDRALLRPGHRGLVPPLQRGGREDRKSTRLNSSHVATSYAVFCLKKISTSPLVMLGREHDQFSSFFIRDPPFD